MDHARSGYEAMDLRQPWREEARVEATHLGCGMVGVLGVVGAAARGTSAVGVNHQSCKMATGVSSGARWVEEAEEELSRFCFFFRDLAY